jgi:hypothetical protein
VISIITTIPKSKFKDWPTCERICRMCDGETERDEDGPWFWLINTQRMPKQPIIGGVCFMIYDGKVRGYFDIVDIDRAENWHRHNDPIDKKRTGYSIIMANWHPCYQAEDYTGFQGWRYTHLKP